MFNGTNLNYIGEVNIKILKNSYAYKNAGTEDLFKLIARLLAGEKLNLNQYPASIMLKKDEIDYLNSKLPIRKKYDNSSISTLITASIMQYDLIDTESPTANNNFTLVLYSGNDLALASIELDSTIIRQIQNGRQALIEWSLKVTNKLIEEGEDN